MRYILGIDLGTTAIKAAVFDETGRECSSKTIEYQLITEEPGWAELSVDTYINTFIEASRIAISRAEITPEQVSCLGMSAQGETTIFLDEDNKPLGPAIVWMDIRATKEAQYIQDKLGQAEVQKHTGQPGMDAIWPASKILWMKNNRPEIFAKTKKITQLKGYLCYLMTGRMCCEDSILCTTMYWDINTRKYWPEMMKLIGIDEAMLPEVVKQGEYLGKITPEGANKFGFSENMSINAGALDQACGALGVGNIRPGMFSDCTGSNLAAVAAVDKFILDPDMQMPTFAGAIAGQYMLHAFSSGGMIFKWFRDTFCDLEKEIEAQGGPAAFDQLGKEIEKIPPGNDGLIMIPHLQGSGPPDQNNDQRGVYFGITLAHKKVHFARAVMEGVTMVLRRMIWAMKNMGVHVDNIIALGGGSKSPVWLQMKADATGIPINIMSTTESSACLGAAILAGVAEGIWSSCYEAADKIIKKEKTYYPNPENKAAYDKLYDKWLILQDGMNTFYKDERFK